MKQISIFIASVFFMFLIIGNISAPVVNAISIANCNGADINRDGVVSVEDINMFNDERRIKCWHLVPLDALNVINYLNLYEAGTANSNYELILDTDGDGFVSPIDALIIINKLNSCTDLPSESIVSNADFDKDGFIYSEDKIMFLDALEVYPIGSVCGEGEGNLENIEIFVSTRKDVYSVGEKIELN